MPFEQRLGGAELGQDLVVGHHSVGNMRVLGRSALGPFNI